MKTLQKFLILFLVTALALSLFACGKKDDAKEDAPPTQQSTGNHSAQLVKDAPGTFTIVADSIVVLGYNENGKTLAVAGENELGEAVAAACADISGKPVAEAVPMVLKAMVSNDALIEKTYVMVRQDLGSYTPDKNFIADIKAAAEEELGSSVVVVSTKQLDDDGYFNQDVAKQLLLAYLGGNAKILSASVMIDGQYFLSAEKDGLQDDYQVVGHSGTVAPYVEDIENSLTEEDMIPEDQQFDIVVDEPSFDEDPIDDTAEDQPVTD